MTGQGTVTEITTDSSWLSEALDQLPVALCLIDDQGRVVTRTGALRTLVGEVIASRDEELRRIWRVFDRDGAEVDPSQWPSERALRGETLLEGMTATMAPAKARPRAVRIISAPLLDTARSGRCVALLQDLDPEQRALSQMKDSLERGFVETLLDAIRKVSGSAGQGQPEAAFLSISRAMQFQPESARVRAERLSPREEDVLRLIAWGLSHKEIASQLGIAVKTVEFHRAGAIKKAGISTRAEIVRYAVAQGWMNDL